MLIEDDANAGKRGQSPITRADNPANSFQLATFPGDLACHAQRVHPAGEAKLEAPRCGIKLLNSYIAGCLGPDKGHDTISRL
jgi:hypothetical protein